MQNLDKIKNAIGSTIFNHVMREDKTQLEQAKKLISADIELLKKMPNSADILYRYNMELTLINYCLSNN
jgi:hypothetical protein